MLGWIVGLSAAMGYCLANLLFFTDALVRQMNSNAVQTPGLPEDEQKWRKMLEKEQ